MIQYIKAILKALRLQGAALRISRLYAETFPTQVITREKIKYKVDLSEVIDFGIFFGGWERGTIDFLRTTIHKGDCIIEVGANVGAHTLLIAKYAGNEGHVFAFEPTEFALKKLRTNIALNPDLKNITIRTELVTDNLNSLPNLTINSSWKRTGVQAPTRLVEPKGISIDEFVKTEAMKKLDLLKIDVDGYEFKVLSGARETISNFKPTIFCELCEYTLNAQNDSIRDIFALLNSLGYQSYFENGNQIKAADDVLSIVGTNTSINGVFFHKSKRGSS